MDFDEFLLFPLNRSRASVNSFLSQFEPLALIFFPIFTLFVARVLRSIFAVISDKGLKSAIFEFVAIAVKLIPGVKKYIDAEKQKVVNKLQGSGKSKRDGWRTELPLAGLGGGVIDKMKDEKQKDVAWQGKCSGTVYIAGNEQEGHFSLINKACSMFAHTNPLHLDVFQSVVRFEAEVVAMTAAILGGLYQFLHIRHMTRLHNILISNCCVFLLSKIFELTLKQSKGVLTETPYWIISQIHLSQVVGSAPGFPHGIIDPIEELGELASTFGICLHVDLCLGGFVLPFARKLGYPIPPFDFSVQGVTSISVDVHKYGLAPKGTSVVLYRNHDIRKHQFVAVTEWTGGLYVSPTIAGSRPGGLIAGAWAAMMSLGLEGYLENTRKIMETSKKIERGVREIHGLFVVGKPDMTIVAFGSNILDIFEVNDIMSSKGWHLNALQRPNSIHICVTLQHVHVVEELLEDLRDSVQTVKANPGPLDGGLAPIYGAAGKMPDRAMVKDLLVDFMDTSC